MQVFDRSKNFHFDSLFHGLPAPVGRDFATMLREFASFLDEKADEAEDRDKQRASNQDHLQWMRSVLPRLMVDALKQCPDADRAALAVHAKTGVQPVTIIHYWRLYELEKKAAGRRDRDRRIYLLARQGKTQAEISDELGVSQPTVSRVINRFSSP
ncbi:helix-turn-helix domain-containing protein [Kordiimonas sp.]|uniref:helix-turn-helix domain-containing protein n=1 Tax=Kordiimonas sp. TaxID=1970157 RepID=UPI003B52003F